MLSRMATVEEVRGVPSLLMRRRRSLWVISFACGRAGGEEVAKGGAACGAFAGCGGAGFFAFLPVTCDQRGTTGGRVGLGAWMCGAAGAGPLSAGEVGFGVGVGHSWCKERIRVSSLLRPWCVRRPEDSVYGACPPPCEGGRADSKQRRCWCPRLNHNRWPRATRHGEGVGGGLSQRLEGVGRGVESGIVAAPGDHSVK